jgi:HEAT repeat protein
MGRVGQLVAAYTPLLQPCHDMAAAKRYSNAIREFRADVRKLGDVEAEIVGGLRGLLVDSDWRRIDLWLNAADERASAGLVAPLCDLLDVRDRYIQHEWIAATLGEIGSVQAIRALADACSFDIDPSRSLNQRCLDALAEIGTTEAITAIRSQLTSTWPEVREYAAELLADEK